jgi:hypothetical protein
MAEAELRPYEPTWRDWLAGKMMGDTRASPERQAFVGGLLGSTGLGTTQANISDFMPQGILFSGQEMTRAQEAGNKTDALLNAMALIPGARVPAKIAKEGVESVAAGVRGYHGSPYNFDRFDMSKIGTGEGAQAYGHGLYLAEAEKIAKGYRDALSPRKAIDDLPGYSQGAAQLILNKGDVGEKMFRDHYADLGPENVERAITEAKAAIASRPTGHMYEVNYKVDQSQLLDWDKPLSQQSEIVKNIVGKDMPQSAKGSAVYEHLQNKFGALDWPADATRDARSEYRNKSAEQASKYLLEQGVPGIRYLDAGSRGNAFKVELSTSKGPYAESVFPDAQQAAAYAKAKEAEGFKANLIDQGSRNYVVFDDKLIEILRKYGLAGMIGGGATMSAGSLLGKQDGNM